MKTILGIKGLELTEYAIAANAIVGIRDSGKTYTATKASEELFDAGIPFIWLDPIGVAHNLRVPGKGKGYPVVVAGGKHGDLPLTVQSVGKIVRAAMQGNISLVLDLFSIDLTKADWRRIVKETCEILLHENASHGMRHVFIEEAAEFVPQRIQDNQTFSAVEKLVRMGGNSKVGITLINQRSADLNKSVLELCANVFVHRQRGKNTLLDLKKWMSLTDPETEKKISASLPDLKSGQCWVMSNDLKVPVLIKVPEKNSLHPDRRAAPISSADLKKHQPVPADDFVAKMKAALAPVPKPTKAAALLSPSTKEAAKSDVAALRDREAAFAAGQREGHADGWEAGFVAGHVQGYKAAEDTFRKAAGDAIRGVVLLPPMPQPPKPPKINGGVKIWKESVQSARALEIGMAVTTPRPSAFRQSQSHAKQIPANGLGKAERAILGVVAHFPDTGVDRAKAALMAGYSSKSGSFRNTLSALRTAGLLGHGDPLVATDAGVAAAGEIDPLPTGVDLLAFWCGHSALGKAEREMLTKLVNALPDGLDRDQLGDLTGYSAASGSFRNSLSTLRTLGLITGKGNAPLQAAEEFA